MVQTIKVTWQHKSYTDTLMSISPFHKKSSLEASQELLDCCFCPQVLIIIIIMSRATDNGVQRSIMKIHAVARKACGAGRETKQLVGEA